jgi:GNAT superfamily N-acetyltransferase
MIAIRPVESDADLQAWIDVRREVVPTESAGTVEQHRARNESKSVLMLVAEVGGELAGSGMAALSDLRDRAFVAPRVLPAMRRRGVGTTILRALLPHAESLGVNKVNSLVTDPGSRSFAEQHGFEEVDSQVEQVRMLDEPLEFSGLPEGVEVVTIAERPELLEAAYPLACEGWEDFATVAPARLELVDWLRYEATLPAGSFVALADGEIVGYSGLCQHDNDGVAEDGLTVVRRDWRRRGLAAALKQNELAWAAAKGYHVVVTWTQNGNEGMRALNARLGYEYRDVATMMVAPLPLP